MARRRTRFLDPRSSRGSRTSSCSRARWSRASSTGCTARRLRRVARLRRAPRLHAGRRHPPHRLAALRAHRPVLVKEFEADTNANFIVLLDVSGSMALRRADHQARLRAIPGGLPGLPRAASSATASGSSPSTSDVVEYVPPSAKHLDVCCTRSTGPRPSGPGSCARRCASSPSLRPPRIVVADLGPLRGAGGRCFDAHRRRPRPRERRRSCSTCSTRRSSTSRSTRPPNFEDLESGEQLPVVPDACARAYRELIQAHIATLPPAAEERVDYALFDTSQPLDHALFNYLSTASGSTRVEVAMAFLSPALPAGPRRAGGAGPRCT